MVDGAGPFKVSISLEPRLSEYGWSKEYSHESGEYKCERAGTLAPATSASVNLGSSKSTSGSVLGLFSKSCRFMVHILERRD